MGKISLLEKKGHGNVNMRTAIQRSCDVYFYEVARLLGVDRLSETAKKFGLGKTLLDGFIEERSGVVPNTTWKKKFIGKNWYLVKLYTLELAKVTFSQRLYNYV